MNLKPWEYSKTAHNLPTEYDRAKRRMEIRLARVARWKAGKAQREKDNGGKNHG